MVLLESCLHCSVEAGSNPLANEEHGQRLKAKNRNLVDQGVVFPKCLFVAAEDWPAKHRRVKLRSI